MRGALIIFCFLAFIALAPSCPKRNADYFFNEGEDEYSKKEYVKAIKYYNIALIKDPDYINAYFERAICKMAIDSFASAVWDFSYVIAHKPSGTAYYLRGTAKSKCNDEAGACADWQSGCDLLNNKCCDLVRVNCK